MGNRIYQTLNNKTDHTNLKHTTSEKTYTGMYNVASLCTHTSVYQLYL